MVVREYTNCRWVLLRKFSFPFPALVSVLECQQNDDLVSVSLEFVSLIKYPRFIEFFSIWSTGPTRFIVCVDAIAAESNKMSGCDTRSQQTRREFVSYYEGTFTGRTSSCHVTSNIAMKTAFVNKSFD